MWHIVKSLVILWRPKNFQPLLPSHSLPPTPLKTLFSSLLCLLSTKRENPKPLFSIAESKPRSNSESLLFASTHPSSPCTSPQPFLYIIHLFYSELCVFSIFAFFFRLKIMPFFYVIFICFLCSVRKLGR